MGFGQNLKTRREERRLTQSQLAEAVGVTQGLVAQYENSQRSPSIHTALRLARFLGVTIDALLAGEDVSELIPPTPMEPVGRESRRRPAPGRHDPKRGK